MPHLLETNTNPRSLVQSSQEASEKRAMSTVKIALVGPKGVGKTILTNALAGDYMNYGRLTRLALVHAQRS